jgi:hypothetical protein
MTHTKTLEFIGRGRQVAIAKPFKNCKIRVINNTGQKKLISETTAKASTSYYVEPYEAFEDSSFDSGKYLSIGIPKHWKRSEEEGVIVEVTWEDA